MKNFRKVKIPESCDNYEYSVLPKAPEPLRFNTPHIICIIGTVEDYHIVSNEYVCDLYIKKTT